MWAFAASIQAHDGPTTVPTTEPTIEPTTEPVSGLVSGPFAAFGVCAPSDPQA